MKEINFSIINWSAWAPGLETIDDWTEWALNKKSISDDFTLSPNIDFIDAMQRRRLSQLTKMALKTSHDCLQNHENNIESVFASRYGELKQTIKLLKAISDKTEVSPAGFSLSVHNSAAGINSIITKNTAAYTAIAASEMTFEMAFIEALGRLQNQEKILLVVGEEYVKEIIEAGAPFTVALLLAKNDGQKISATFGEKKLQHENSALSFLKWLIADTDKIFPTKLISFAKK